VDGRSPNALLRGGHPLLPRLPNFRVTAIADEVWEVTRTLITESLPLVEATLIERQAKRERDGKARLDPARRERTQP